MPPTDNLSAVLYAINDLRLDQAPLPSEPGKNEVILESHTVGICGSDVHFLTEGRIGPFILKSPTILGHETSATVVKVGPGVKGLKAGDRVAVEPQVPCRICDVCKTGRYNACPDTNFLATPPSNGSLTRYFKHAADFCFKLPDHMSHDEATLMEPLAVAVHACRRAGVRTGDRVLVCGAGPIGLVSLLVSKAFGATAVCVTDINAKRLTKAKDMGADNVYVATLTDPEEQAKQVVQLLGGDVDVAIECSGAGASKSLAIHAVKIGGVVMLVGMGGRVATVPLDTAICKEIDIRTSLRYSNSYPLALSLIASGKVDPKPLITHRFELEDALEAFEVVKRGEGIKVMINCKKN